MQIIQWFIAVTTAIFVAVVAFLQWRTAQQKAALDLFDRRYAIYEIVRKAVETMTSNSNAFDLEREVEFMQAMERAYFFFGDDVVSYLERLWGAILDVRDVDKEFPDTKDPAMLHEALGKRSAHMSFIAKFHEIGNPVFGKYMRFSEGVPSTSHYFGKKAHFGPH